MLRFATIGTSSIVDLCVESMRLVDQVELAATYSRDAARAAAYAERHGAGRGVSRLQELAQADDVDAVYVASPNTLHHAQAKVLVEGGKHVLVEKSACANADEWRDLVAAAERHGVVVVESVRSVFEPSWRTVESYVDSLGALRQVSFQMCQRSRRYDNYLAGTVENIFKPEMAAGALMDLGVYCLHPLATLFGLPGRVQASSVKLSNGIDATTSLLLDYPGFTATVLCSKVSRNASPGVIAGEDATLYIDAVADTRSLGVDFGDGPEQLPVERPLPQQAYVLQAFARMVEDPSLARVHQQATLDALTVMDEARRQVGLRFPNDR